jgi:hypothetical protein
VASYFGNVGGDYRRTRIEGTGTRGLEMTAPIIITTFLHPKDFAKEMSERATETAKRNSKDLIDKPRKEIDFKTVGTNALLRGYAKYNKCGGLDWVTGFLDRIGHIFGYYSEPLLDQYDSILSFKAALNTFRTKDARIQYEVKEFRAQIMRTVLTPITKNVLKSRTFVVPPPAVPRIPTFHFKDEVPPLVRLMVEAVANNGPQTRGAMEAYITNTGYVSSFRTLGTELAYVVKHKWVALFKVNKKQVRYIYSLDTSKIADWCEAVPTNGKSSTKNVGKKRKTRKK